MKALIRRLSSLPIQWKLIIGASFLLCFLFISYNTVQYFVLNHWLIKQEERTIQKNMNELQSYFAEKTIDDKQIKNSQNFIDKLNQRHQMIRILDETGVPILTVSDELPEEWVPPKKVTQTELISLWHITDHIIVMRSPLISTHFTGTIEIVDNLENFDKISDLLLVIMFIGGIGAILLSGGGGFLLTRQLLKPIQSITETMRKIKLKGLHERVIIVNNHDELSKLATMFNEMMDQVQLSFQQQQQFVEDASHELRTPIAIMEGHLSLLNRWGKDDPVLLNESLLASLQELDRLKTLVQNLLELSHAEALSQGHSTELIDPSQIIVEVIKNMIMLHPEFKIDINVLELTGVGITMAPHHFKQILHIFLDNSIKYSTENKLIQIRGSIKNANVQIQIVDYGLGIPEADLPFVFDRLYRVDKARSGEQSGHGLGLSIAQRLVESYSGTVVITSSANKGTTVTLSFPLYP
jgi:two-component system sensor histidine kinase ArlS